MKKKILLLFLGIMLCAANAFATPIDIKVQYVEVNPSQKINASFADLQGVSAALAGSYVIEIDGERTFTYCVDTAQYAPVGKGLVQYKLEDLNIKYMQAAWIMSNYLPTLGNRNNVIAQVAIWEIISSDLVGNLADGAFKVNSRWNDDEYNAAQNLVDQALKIASFDTSNFKLAKSGDYQDFLIYSPVPEPATMLLLGSGLVGLAGFGRKKLFKRS